VKSKPITFSVQELPATPPASAEALALFTSAYARQTIAPLVIVGAGSSTTAGGNSSSIEKRWLNRFASAASAAANSAVQSQTLPDAIQNGISPIGTTLINAAIGGTVGSTYLTAKTARDIGRLSPTVVIHMVGSNDFARDIDPAVYGASIRERIQQIDDANTSSNPTLHVLVQSYQQSGPSVLDGVLFPWSEYGNQLSSIAQERSGNVVVVDLSNSYSQLGVPGNDPSELIDGDGVHQVDRGHAVMAELIRQAMGVPRVSTITGFAAIITAGTAILKWDASPGAGDQGYLVTVCPAIGSCAVAFTALPTFTTANSENSRVSVSALTATGSGRSSDVLELRR
jgi:lysophospholipase L1-like esterase